MGARTLNKLTAVKVSKIKAPGRHSDGGGLYLFIDRHGRRRWIFMYSRRGRRSELGLGGARDVTLAAARTEAAALRAVLIAGRDPRAEREKIKGLPTFGEFADEYVKAMTPSWRNPKHAAQWKMTLAEYAAPIRARSIDEVDTHDILKVLKPVWNRTPETAERLRGRIESVLSAAKARGYRTGDNPATWRGHLDQLLPKRQKLSRGHHTALPYVSAPKFLKDLRSRSAPAARALEFAILTAARTNEVLEADWSEIDRESRVWTIPAARMKAGREHRVPLATRALAILDEMARSGASGLVFPGPRPTEPLSAMAMTMLLRRMDVKATVHGFRSTFRDWASETTLFPHEVCELALAHVISNKTEAAYRRGDLLKKRQDLMEAWSSYCSGNPR